MQNERTMQPEIAVVHKQAKEEQVPKDREMVKEVEFSEEENREQLRGHEEDFIQGLIDASGYALEETQRVEIIREGRLYFAFCIHPLSEEEYNECKKKNTRYVRNRQLGMKIPEETDSAKYRASLIYQATTEEDRKNLWDNKKVWEALRAKGMQIVRGLDVIEYSLKAGEKDRILEAIDKLSGYEENLEEVIKN